jgi:hypothetical protein
MPGLRKSAAKFGFKMAMQKVRKEIKKDGDLTLSELNKMKRGAKVGNGKGKGGVKIIHDKKSKRKQLTVDKTTEFRVKSKPKKPKRKQLTVDKTTEFRVKKKPKKPKNGGLSISELKDISIKKPLKTKKQRKKKTRTVMDKKKLLRRTHRLDEKRKRKRKKKPLTGLTAEETRVLEQFTKNVEVGHEKITSEEMKILNEFLY